MKHVFKAKFYRFFLLLTALALVAMMLPQPVQAAAGASVEIVSVKADESVTIRAKNFPANHTITVRMDVSGNAGINGIVVGESNSGSTGSFEATYKIPAELKGVKTISIRLEGSLNWLAYNWFNNQTGQTSQTAGPTPVAGSAVVGPSVKVTAVEKNERITVSVAGFPANVNFRVRVGPFYTFSRNYAVTQTVNSGKGGSFQFNVELPSMVKDTDLVAIRLDSIDSATKYFAYNAFKNETSGTIGSTTTTAGPVVANACELVSTGPSNKTMPVRFDFDVTWKIKNTSGKDWNLEQVDYKFVSGTELQKFGKVFDLPKTVKNGETIELRVDMLAPSNTGVYTTNWALVQGSTTLCSLPLTITVK
ncbi:MAG TPA: NBR1-Ig-like domain-containing protein [Anaerolineaceae bacterium]|nr:NBR1-Ig-like domain-containing protein [Anaerolineaceae bacterium]